MNTHRNSPCVSMRVVPAPRSAVFLFQNSKLLQALPSSAYKKKKKRNEGRRRKNLTEKLSVADWLVYCTHHQKKRRKDTDRKKPQADWWIYSPSPRAVGEHFPKNTLSLIGRSTRQQEPVQERRLSKKELRKHTLLAQDYVVNSPQRMCRRGWR